VGWILFGSLLLVTAAHAFLRALGQLRKLAPRPAPRAALLALALALWTGPARAAEPASRAGLSEWPIDHADPMSSVPALQELNENPLQAGYFLMDLGEKADQAERAGRHLEAARYYLAIAKMVPERATGFAKACAAYQALGQLPEALEACAIALNKPGVRVEDYLRYSELVLAGPEPLTPDELSDLGSVVAHLREQGRTQAAEKVQCEVAFRQEDRQRLSECSAALFKLAPNDPKTVSYQWSLALLEKDYAESQKLIARARTLGVKPEVLEKMAYVTSATIPFWRRTSLLLSLLAALAVLGAIIFVVRQNRRERFSGPRAHNAAATP
jgi:hypothetical protein